MAGEHSTSSCPFCDLPEDRIFARDEFAMAFWDKYPVSPGHALIVPRRHIPSWFDATEPEQCALVAMINTAKPIIDQSQRPEGYNVGINIGAAAGQTVFHLHIHLIPRFVGDVKDPRGGVRYVIPAKANYMGGSGSGKMPDPGPTV